MNGLCGNLQLALELIQQLLTHCRRSLKQCATKTVQDTGRQLLRKDQLFELFAADGLLRLI
ncbi:MAG: hypothetical protein DI587_14485 [Variovorax paradoxus]|nr:MAG: hypothetical protein DI583_14485 [Variovorax paradoxus]PZQ09622.1 MAG: hypothetical protein DI587_14485 [Variovorax paradoxus]